MARRSPWRPAILVLGLLVILGSLAGVLFCSDSRDYVPVSATSSFRFEHEYGLVGLYRWDPGQRKETSMNFVLPIAVQQSLGAVFYSGPTGYGLLVSVWLTLLIGIVTTGFTWAGAGRIRPAGRQRRARWALIVLWPLTLGALFFVHGTYLNYDALALRLKSPGLALSRGTLLIDWPENRSIINPYMQYQQPAQPAPPHLVLWPAFSSTAPGWSLTLPSWLLLVPALAFTPMLVKRARAVRKGVCPNCLYSRAGIPESAPCPECGRVTPTPQAG